MEEIDITQVLKMFWNNKIQIFLTVIIFALIGVIYSLEFVKPVYTSSTTLVLATSNTSVSNDSSITTNDITINSKLVSTYSELVKSKKILRKVMYNLNIDANEETLRKNIQVNAVKNTELIKITVTNDEPYYAAKIANEIANVFIDTIREIYNIENIHVVDVAEVEEIPSNINHKRDVILFIGIGFIISILYISIINMFDTTIKTEEEIERRYHLPVLALIPVCDENLNPKTKKGGKR